jgi:putative tryptophan/tyrosine transport system substrate-binding protein
LLHELVPSGADVVVLLNPESPIAVTALKDMEEAASAIGQNLTVLHASTKEDINAAFKAMAKKQAPALVIVTDALFTGRRVQLVTLAARHAVPAIYTSREFAEVGGLMTYGVNLADGRACAGGRAAAQRRRCPERARSAPAQGTDHGVAAPRRCGEEENMKRVIGLT